jgi:hypothetical protein
MLLQKLLPLSANQYILLNLFKLDCAMYQLRHQQLMYAAGIANGSSIIQPRNVGILLPLAFFISPQLTDSRVGEGEGRGGA